MAISLYDFLEKEIKKMAGSLGRDERGNIYGLIMHEVERYLLTVVLEETKYNYYRSAKILGIGRSTLYRRISSLGIEKRKVKRPETRP
jgi:Response regulator containing CheY-like receiver, AAA-type ATPase, and DNA-binding domains